MFRKKKKIWNKNTLYHPFLLLPPLLTKISLRNSPWQRYGVQRDDSWAMSKLILESSNLLNKSPQNRQQELIYLLLRWSYKRTYAWIRIEWSLIFWVVFFLTFFTDLEGLPWFWGLDIINSKKRKNPQNQTFSSKYIYPTNSYIVFTRPKPTKWQRDICAPFLFHKWLNSV